MERASKFERGLKTEELYYIEKEMNKLAFDSLPWRRKHVFTGEKKIHNLHFHPQSFYAFFFFWSEYKKQKPFLLRYSEAGSQLRSAQIRWDGTEIYFLCSFLGPASADPPLEGGSGKSSPIGVVPVRGEDWGQASPGDPGLLLDQEEHTVSSADPEDVEGGAVHHMDLQCVSMAGWLERTDQAATSGR